MPISDIGKQKAELEAKIAELEGEKLIEEQKQELIEIQISNYEKETIEKAKIQADSLIEEAKGKAQSETIKQEQMIEIEVSNVKIAGWEKRSVRLS